MNGQADPNEISVDVDDADGRLAGNPSATIVEARVRVTGTTPEGAAFARG